MNREDLPTTGYYAEEAELDDMDLEFLEIAQRMHERDPFRKLILEDGPTIGIYVPMRYTWENGNPLVLGFAEQVGFPKDRDLLIFCWFYFNHIIEVDPCFILDEDELADLDDITISFSDFPDIDFQPLYEEVARGAVLEMEAKGCEMSAYKLELREQDAGESTGGDES